MQFNVPERLLLLSSLGTVEGNLTTLRVVRDLQRELGFSEEEHKELGLRQADGKTFWNTTHKIPPKEVSVGPAALDAALLMFRKLDELEKLTFENLPLYERLLKEKDDASSTEKGPVAV